MLWTRPQCRFLRVFASQSQYLLVHFLSHFSSVSRHCHHLSTMVQPVRHPHPNLLTSFLDLRYGDQYLAVPPCPGPCSFPRVVPTLHVLSIIFDNRSAPFPVRDYTLPFASGPIHLHLWFQPDSVFYYVVHADPLIPRPLRHFCLLFFQVLQFLHLFFPNLLLDRDSLSVRRRHLWPLWSPAPPHHRV